MNDLSSFLEEVTQRLLPEQVFEGNGFDHDWKKSGDKWRGKCPWHESKSGTAFYLNSSKLAWRCPSCGVGGGPVQYLHQIRGGHGSPIGQGFVSIAKELSEVAGLQFPDRQMTAQEKLQAQRVENRRAMLECVIEYCHRLLLTESRKAIAYLMADKRRLTQEDIEDPEMKLGVFPSADRVAKYLYDHGFDLADAAEYGFIYEKYDRPGHYGSKLEGYITVPWHDANGRPLTIYGRWHEDAPPEGRPKTYALHNPKEDRKDWLRTKTSPLYFDRAIAAGHKHLVVVEGVFDGFLAQRRGDSRAIAWVAAHPSGDQIETLIKYKIESITFALDPDLGGDRGIRAGIVKLTQAGITTYVAPRLPEGKDPDEFISEFGIDAWYEHIERKVHGFRYEARKIAEDCQPLTDSGIADAIALADKFVAKVPANLTRLLQPYFWNEFESLTGVGSRNVQKKEEIREDDFDFNSVLDRVDDLESAIPSDSQLAWEVQNFAYEAGLAKRGFSGGKLIAMARSRKDNVTEAESVDALDLIASDDKPDWLIAGIALRGVVSMIAGKGGEGKTSLCYNWVKHIATGAPWSGHRVRQGKCLIVQADEPKTNIQQKLQVAKFQHVPRGSVTIWTKWNFNQFRQLERFVKDRGIDYLLIDSWTAAHMGVDVDLTKSSSSVGAYLLRNLAAETGCHIDLIHHLNLQGGYRDSSSLFDAVSDASRLYKGTPEDKLLPGQIIWDIEKSRSGSEGKYILQQNPHDYSYQHLGAFEDPDEPGSVATIGRVLELIEGTTNTLGTKDVASALDIDYGKADIKLKRLYRQGLIGAEWKTFNTGADDKQSGFWLYSINQRRESEPDRVATGIYEEDF